MGLKDFVKKAFGGSSRTDSETCPYYERLLSQTDLFVDTLSLFADTLTMLKHDRDVHSCGSAIGGYIKGCLDSKGLNSYSDDIYAGVSAKIKADIPVDIKWPGRDAFLSLAFSLSSDYINNWEKYQKLTEQGWGSEGYRAEYKSSLELLADRDNQN